MAAIARLARSRLYVPLTRHSLHSGTPGWRLCRERIAFGGLRNYTATPVNSELMVPKEPQRSKLVVPGGSYRFPRGVGEFTTFRDNLVYIDKTQFIFPLSKFTATLLCHPRRFGKTLTVSMLRNFHGVEYKDEFDEFFGVCGRGN